VEKFNDYKKKFEKETGTKIEIRKNLKIHDRWLICGDKCWSIGSSIKDLGNKDTLIKELDGVTSSLTDLFQLRWDESIPFES
jgi:predicted PolB exonuclease-like 3'-5' exonuclease